MTRLYVRPGGRAPIYWEPDQSDIGKQAVESEVGPVESYPADVNADDARQIREEYERLIGGTN